MVANYDPLLASVFLIFVGISLYFELMVTARGTDNS